MEARVKIKRHCPNCGVEYDISHDDLVGIVHDMSKQVVTVALGPDRSAYYAAEIAREARFQRRFNLVQIVCWYVVVAMSLYGAAMAYLHPEALSAPVVIVVQLTLALTACVQVFGLTPSRRRRSP